MNDGFVVHLIPTRRGTIRGLVTGDVGTWCLGESFNQAISVAGLRLDAAKLKGRGQRFRSPLTVNAAASEGRQL
jgi:hypothetical protein